MNGLTAETFRNVAAWIAPWKRTLLVSHEKPDGDALGALAATRSLLRANGVSATALLYDDLPGQYEVFNRYEPMAVLGRDVREADLDRYDGIMVLDTCTLNQLRPIDGWFRGCTLPKLVIDHHVTREDVADCYLIDQTAAATCLIIYDWARAVEWPIETETDEALFIGVATDTGWFRHSNTDGRVLSAAADLVVRGGHPHDLYQRLYQREKPARVRLLGAALNTLELLCDGRLAVMTLSAEAIARAGATRNDTEDIVNEPMRIGSVAVSVLLVEAGDGNVRINFRSKPPARNVTASDERWGPVGRTTAADAGAPDIDVARIAAVYGGGGHTRAAGARIHGTLPDVRRTVVGHLQPMFAADPAAGA